MNFLTKRVMFVYIQHIDAMMLCFCLVLGHKCGKNEKSGTRGAAECSWCSFRILTFLWSFTERTNGDMESICFYDEKHQVTVPVMTPFMRIWWRHAFKWWRHTVTSVMTSFMRLSSNRSQEPIKMIIYLTFYSVYELVFRPVAIGELHFFYFFYC